MALIDKNISLINLSYFYNGNIKLMYKHLDEPEYINTNFLLKNNEKYFTIIDNEYPKEFVNIDFKPLVLYYRGNINLLKTRIRFP